MAEYYDKASDKWIESDTAQPTTESAEQPKPDIGMLERAYNAVPGMVSAVGDTISNAASGVYDYGKSLVTPTPQQAVNIGTSDSMQQSDLSYNASRNQGLYEQSDAGKAEKLRQQYYREQAKNTSPLEAFVVGANREGLNLVRGLKNNIDHVPYISKVWGGPERADQRDKEWKKNDIPYQSLESAHPVATTVGGMSPYMLPISRPFNMASKVPGYANMTKTPARALYNFGGKLSSRETQEAVQRTALGLRNLPKTLAKSPAANSLAMGAGVGAVHPDLTAKEGLFYAGAGHGIASGISGKLAKPKNFNRLEKNTVLDRLESRGYNIDPGVRTGDKRMQQIDQAFIRNPDLAGPFRDAKLENQLMDNLTISKTVGEKTNNLSGEWFSRNKELLNRKYDEIYANLEATQSPEIRNKISGILRKYESDFGNVGTGINPNIDPIVKTYVQKTWDMLGHGKTVPMGKWKAVTKQVETRIEQFSKDPAKQHLVPYFQELRGSLRDMVKGSKNKEFLNRLERNDFKMAVLENARKNTNAGGDINMINMADVIKNKYTKPFMSKSTGNKVMDDYYDSLKGALYRNSTEGASLGVSDRISKLFRNPTGMNAGRLSYLFSSGGQSPGAVSNLLVGLYRKSPKIGVSQKLPGYAGEIASRYSISDR
jgi:hypothetical protein